MILIKLSPTNNIYFIFPIAIITKKKRKQNDVNLI